MIINVFLYGSQVGIQLIVVILAIIACKIIDKQYIKLSTVALILMLIKRILSTLAFIQVFPDYYNTINEISQAVLPFLISIAWYISIQSFLRNIKYERELAVRVDTYIGKKH